MCLMCGEVAFPSYLQIVEVSQSYEDIPLKSAAVRRLARKVAEMNATYPDGDECRHLKVGIRTFK